MPLPLPRAIGSGYLSMNERSMQQKEVRKPCDQCTRRKVRCNYENPCNRCKDTNLACTHSIIRKKRGPRKGRGAVLDHLRSNSSDAPASFSGAPRSVPLEQQTAISEPEIARTVSNYGSPIAPQPTTLDTVSAVPVPDQLPTTTSMSIAGLTADPVAFDDSFLTFDEFAQNVLADADYFPHEAQTTSQESYGIFGATPNQSVTTPLEIGSYATPQTALATTIAIPETTDRFEVTPLVERSVELFFMHIFPIYPLLSRDKMYGYLQTPQLLSKSEITLLWSICASTLVIVDSWPNLGTEQRALSGRRFVRKCQQLRLEWDYMEEACYEDILTSLFIANTFFDLKCRRSSWIYVREAISLAVSMGLHDDSTYSFITEEEQIRRKRAYALLYITERGASILDGFPVSIIMPPILPDSRLPDETPTIAPGLAALHGLFSLLDFKYVKLWNDPNHIAFGTTVYSDLFSLQTHLRELQIDTTGLSEVQTADVLITQQWLRMIFWQASLRQGFISTTADDAAFTYNYPIDIAMALCEVVKSLPPIAIQVHGLGIFEKQFEVAYSLMDCLALSGTTQPEHHECLRYLLLSLSASPTSRQVYVRTLEKKMGGQQKYRSLAGVQLLRDDGGSRQNSRRASIFPAQASTQ